LLVVEALSQPQRQAIPGPRPTARLWVWLKRLAICWQQYTGVALAALTLTWMLLLLGRWGFDDPFVTFRYARNLLAGHGLVYNVGQRTLSTTTPLFAVLLAGLSLVGPGSIEASLPVVANVVSALALVCAALVLVHWTRRRGQPVVGLVAALLLCASPLLLTTLGTEICLYLLLALFGFCAYDRDHWFLAAAALALATMVRPEGVLAVVAIGLSHLARRQPVPWRALALYVALVGGWYGSLWIYYGSPVPVTLLTKQQQGQMAISTRFAPGLWQRLQTYGRQPLYWLHGGLIVVGLARVVKKARHWLPLLLWIALYLAAYTLLGVSRYFWYYAPLVPASVILVAEGAVALIRVLGRVRLPSRARVALGGALLVVLLLPLLQGVLAAAWHPDPRLDLYRDVGRWLDGHTPPQATVGTLEVGITGYYSRRPMVDFAGLIQPEVAQQLAPDHTYADSSAWAIQTYQPEYVVLRRELSAPLSSAAWFQAAYAPERVFTDGRGLWLTLFRRSDSP
jgi:hypothetical protein